MYVLEFVTAGFNSADKFGKSALGKDSLVFHDHWATTDLFDSLYSDNLEFNQARTQMLQSIRAVSTRVFAYEGKCLLIGAIFSYMWKTDVVWKSGIVEKREKKREMKTG